MSKQIKIKRESLPPLNAQSVGYLVRFRIISEDKSNTSYWSPIYSIPVDVDYTVEECKIGHNSGITTVAWKPVSGLTNYDIFISWSDTALTYNWEYYGRVASTSIILPSETGLNKFSIRVFRPTQTPSVSTSSFLIYENLDKNV